MTALWALIESNKTTHWLQTERLGMCVVSLIGKVWKLPKFNRILAIVTVYKQKTSLSPRDSTVDALL